MLRIHDTYSRAMADVRPAGDALLFYSCGPTIHDFSHVGNSRYYVWVDVFKRVVKARGIPVRHVMNITDVEDKIIRRAQEAGIDVTDPKRIPEYTKRYEQAFLEDLTSLRTLPPDQMPHATEMVPEMVAFVEKLIRRGHAYESAGSVYFRIASFPAYGKLSHLDPSAIRDGARVDNDEYEKEQVRDFVLWKAAKEGEPIWKSPWGPGRPGWHLECSVMSIECLGSETIDVHAGGEDLVFPHHENEIAQSEGATGVKFCRAWLHGAHLRVDDRKMSKSLGNFHTLRELVERGHSPASVRYLLSSTHYRAPLNLTEEALESSSRAVERLAEFARLLASAPTSADDSPELETALASARTEMDTALDDDLNTSGALGALFTVVRDVNAALAKGALGPRTHSAARELLAHADSIFAFLPEGGLSMRTLRRDVAGKPYEVTGVGDVPDSVLESVVSRQAARRSKDFAAADRLRDELTAGGWLVEDVPGGARVRRSGA